MNDDAQRDGRITDRVATVQTLDTPDGPFTLVADRRGAVLASGWSAERSAVLARIRPGARPLTLVEGVTAAAEAVTAYYAGDLDAVRGVPLRLVGTDLQRAGWAALRGIRPGRPLGYAAFAALVGRPGAVRAAASICARNPTALFVPCHRVLRSDGSLGGFAWGVAVKRALLAREGWAGDGPPPFFRTPDVSGPRGLAGR